MAACSFIFIYMLFGGVDLAHAVYTVSCVMLTFMCFPVLSGSSDKTLYLGELQ